MTPTPEQSRRLRIKNIVVGLLLAALVVMFYFLALVRMSANTPS